MKPERPHGSLRLEAEAETIEDLVALVARGEVRIPAIRRELKWTAEDAVALFDSIYRGYPVGSVLLRKSPAEAARVQVGPLSIDAPEREAALWVVDGQQRVTTLAAGLLRPALVSATSADPWVVYFDAASRTLLSLSQDAQVSSTWVPVAHLLDASALRKWVGQWSHAGDPGLRSAVFEAGRLIREYQIPLYIVEKGDEGQLREIFHRINRFGKSLRWEDVRDGLFGQADRHPSTLQEMAEDLRKLGMGTPERAQLLSCLMAVKGRDVARAEVLAEAAPDLLPAARRALSFLKLHAEIPHLRLLPQSIPLTVLTRFFAVYREPNARSLALLTRWTWRLLLSQGAYNQRTLLRQSVTAIQEGDEEGCVQALLSLVPKRRRPYVLPQRFEARAADSRIALLGLSSLRPLDLKDGSPIDLSALIDQRGVAAFRRIFSDGEALSQSPANRVLLAGSGSARKELVELSRLQGRESPILLSHAISPRAVDALIQKDARAFLKERKARIEEAVNLLGERLAAWSMNDRPSISYLLGEAEIEA